MAKMNQSLCYYHRNGVVRRKHLLPMLNGMSEIRRLNHVLHDNRGIAIDGIARIYLSLFFAVRKAFPIDCFGAVCGPCPRYPLPMTLEE